MKKNIFLVDDNEMDIMAIERALEDKVQAGKISLQVFNDGEAVINRLEEIQKKNLYLDKTLPHLMILDLNMPKMGGIEVLERIRNDPENKSMVVFILSTSSIPSEIKKAYQNNVAGYLVKDEMGIGYEKLNEFLEAYSNNVSFPRK